MRPPRMRVALFGRSLAGFTLANAMERAGHEVQMLSDPAELRPKSATRMRGGRIYLSFFFFAWASSSATETAPSRLSSLRRRPRESGSSAAAR